MPLSYCSPFSYTYRVDKVGGETGITAPFLSFAANTRTFTVQSTTLSDIGTYLIRVTGTNSDGASGTITIGLEISNPC